MKLIGKCEGDFDDWLYDKYDSVIIKDEYCHMHYSESSITLYDVFRKLPEVCQNALIIEWFDSIDIKIWVSFNDFTKNCFDTYIDDDKLPGFSTSRLEAITVGIEEANKIYNHYDN